LFYPPNIDVRVPLQFLVDVGQLKINGDIQKSKMLGKNDIRCVLSRCCVVL
jgi:hypothetical protein